MTKFCNCCGQEIQDPEPVRAKRIKDLRGLPEVQRPTLLRVLAKKANMKSSKAKHIYEAAGYEVTADGPEYNTARGSQRYLVVNPKGTT